MCSDSEGSAGIPPAVLRPVAVPSDAAAPAMREPAPPCRILLVEDHADTAAMMRRLLARRGYVVTVAATCAEALAAARTRAFDLLLCDIGLPDGSGLDLVGALSQLTKAPAIALSGYGMPEDAPNSCAAGFLVHLTKPVAVEQLWAAIDRVLKSCAAPL